MQGPYNVGSPCREPGFASGWLYEAHQQTSGSFNSNGGQLGDACLLY